MMAVAPQEERRIWDGCAPGSEGWRFDEQWSELPDPLASRVLRNVVEPTLTPYLPRGVANPRQAVVVAPGGGLHFLSMESEGAAVTRWLQERDIAAFLLKYRLVPTPEDDDEFMAELLSQFGSGEASTRAAALAMAVADAGRAVELLRADGIEQLAYLGFSAGARIGAELVLRHPDRRPDVAGFIYLHAIEEVVVPSDAVPLFLLAAADDPLGITGSLDLHAAWRAAGHPVEHHLFERGGHGFGMNSCGLPVDVWPSLFAAWLDQWGFDATYQERPPSTIPKQSW